MIHCESVIEKKKILISEVAPKILLSLYAFHCNKIYITKAKIKTIKKNISLT